MFEVLFELVAGVLESFGELFLEGVMEVTARVVASLWSMPVTLWKEILDWIGRNW